MQNRIPFLNGYWLVVSTPLKNISQLGVGIIIPNIWKNVANHQSG
jgi:hypothetical protein